MFSKISTNRPFLRVWYGLCKLIIIPLQHAMTAQARDMHTSVVRQRPEDLYWNQRNEVDLSSPTQPIYDGLYDVTPIETPIPNTDGALYYPEPVEYVTSYVTIEDGGISFVLPLLVPVTPTPTATPTPTIASTATISSTSPLASVTSVSHSTSLSTSSFSITQSITSMIAHSSSSSHASGSKSPAVVSGTATPSAHSKAKSKDDATGITIGTIIGVLLVFGLIAFIFLFLKRRQRRKKSASKGKQRELPTTTETHYLRQDHGRPLPSIPQASYQPSSQNNRRNSIFSKFRRPDQPVMEERNNIDHLDSAFQRNHDEWRETMRREMIAIAPHLVDNYYDDPWQLSSLR